MSELARRIAMRDADVAYIDNIDFGKPQGELLSDLIRDTPWRAEKIVVWGKTYDQPRLTAWYGDSGRNYRYSGITMVPLSWTPTLSALRQKVESLAATRFNSVLLNFYRNNHDSMGMHSDSEPELGPEPLIASLSLGAVRTIVFKHNSRSDVGGVRIPLESGSLLVMKGGTQAHWKHGIHKEARPCGPRINLTFRTITGARLHED